MDALLAGHVHVPKLVRQDANEDQQHRGERKQNGAGSGPSVRIAANRRAPEEDQHKCGVQPNFDTVNSGDHQRSAHEPRVPMSSPELNPHKSRFRPGLPAMLRFYACMRFSQSPTRRCAR